MDNNVSAEEKNAIVDKYKKNGAVAMKKHMTLTYSKVIERAFAWMKYKLNQYFGQPLPKMILQILHSSQFYVVVG